MIRLSMEGGTARIRLDRPERLNALSPQLLRDLLTACEELADDDSVDVVALEGVGGSFSSPHAVADLGRVACEALADLPQITMGIIRGHCVGGGLVLAAACDLRICADDARFSIPELEVGIPLAWGGMAHLVRLVGETVAADLVLSGRTFTGDEALRAGFVSRVVAASDLDTEASELIDVIGSRARIPLRLT